MNSKYDQLVQHRIIQTYKEMHQWYEDTFLSWEWWLLVILFLGSWVVFIKLVHKEKLHFLLLVGLLWIIISSNLDSIGYDLGLWGYPKQLIPLLPKAYLFDYAIIPVIYMLMYQYFPKGRAFFIANLLVAASAAFIGEPVFHWLGIYKTFHWSSFYSFPIYFVIGYIVKIIVEKVKKTSKINRIQDSHRHQN
ncbi:CBO0543 family protein [Falsibacillus albus]|uniref:Uncharacterized protein n=1 Tax=Falsibacillus albus TaxID=2478915 RepID=A0A3L7K3A9_9BACI|nr:CBO0543 family protein [Falsibacillus albus]RLQ97498.1 hypothetical protein D9X91_04935 [Falsibacillus albus]